MLEKPTFLIPTTIPNHSPIQMQKSDKIFIAGHQGMVGSAIFRLLSIQGYENIITVSKDKLDLCDSRKVEAFFKEYKPNYVFMAAAKVGGIQANIDDPVGFTLVNLAIQNNLIHQSYRHQVKKVLFLGSSCVYPRECPQPIKEEFLLTSPLEKTNEGYALAKIVGLKLLQYYYRQYGLASVSPMFCNLYGPNDNFNLQKCHVLSALVKRFIDAKKHRDLKIELWGSGMAKREFMHVDDAAHACLFLMNNYPTPDHINVGWGADISVKDLANLIAKKVDFNGEIIWDTNKPDGMPRKCLDIVRLNQLGFKPKISLEEGISQMIEIYCSLKT